MSDLKVRIGAIIRRRRRGLGHSQAELADLAGIPQSSVANMEGSGARVNLHNLSAVAIVLGVPIWRLVFEAEEGSEPPEALSPLERAIVHASRSGPRAVISVAASELAGLAQDGPAVDPASLGALARALVRACRS